MLTKLAANGLIIVNLTRLQNSDNGSPRYRVTFDNGLVAQTQSDASINYGITNPEYRNVPLDVYVTRSGKISDLRPQ
jgi:hypothetical protein